MENTVPAGLVVEEWDDSIWHSLLLHPQPVLRAIPAGARAVWLLALSHELDHLRGAPSATAVHRLGAFCRIMLAPLGRGGKRHCRQAVSVISGRIARWEAGQHSQLVQEYLAIALDRRPLQNATDQTDVLPEATRRAAIRAVRDGNLGKAAKLLAELSFAAPDNVQVALQALHPQAPEPEAPAGPDVAGEDFSADDVFDCLKSFPAGSSGGFSGLMATHLPGPKDSELAPVLEKLAALGSDLAWNRLPPDASTALCSARLIAIGKKGGGVRPIAIGELIRRVVGKLLISRYQGDYVQGFVPTQLGVGVRGGAELIIHKLRAWASVAGADQALLQLDFRNAYNSVARSKLLESVQQRCPMFLPFAKAAYGHHGTLFGLGFAIASEEGEHQGCPCGPLFFAAVVDPLTRLCHSEPGCWSHLYLDDGLAHKKISL